MTVNDSHPVYVVALPFGNKGNADKALEDIRKELRLSGFVATMTRKEYESLITGDGE